jgi:hypothetical protein
VLVAEHTCKGGSATLQRGHLIAVVGAFLIGCAALLVVGCAGVRSGAPEDEQGHTEATKKEQARSPEATTSEEASCEGTRTFDVYKKQGIGGIADATVQPGDPEARFITNDVPGCPTGGLLSGTDKLDRLAGEEGEDEVHGLGGTDTLTGGHGHDIIYGGPGDDELYGGAKRPLEFYTDRSKNVLYGGPGIDYLEGDAGDDVLYGGEGDDFYLNGNKGEDVLYGGDGNDALGSSRDGGHRDKLYCGEGWDEARPDKSDYVDSSCEVKR